MTIAGREALMGHNKRRYGEVSINGDTFRLQSLTEKERAAFEGALLGFNRKGEGRVIPRQLLNMKRRLLVATLVNSDGVRILGDEDVDALESVDSEIIEELFQRAQEHIGIKDNIEALAKNSEALHAGDSPTG